MVRTRLILPVTLLLLLVAACTPAATITAQDAYVGAAYNGPIEGVAVVMTSPRASYSNLVESVHMNAITGLTRHPYARARFDVVERSAIEHVLSEARLGSSGFVDANTAPQLGQLVGADYIILFGITMADVRPVGVRGVRVAGLRVGASGANLSVGLTARMIDTTTGRLMSTGYGELTTMVSTGVSVSGTSVSGSATIGMIQEMLPEVVSRSLDDLFRNLDG